jgi:hypothetical protein
LVPQFQNSIWRSYAKTTLTCLALALIAIMSLIFVAKWVPGVAGVLFATLLGLAAIPVAVGAFAGCIVLVRYIRSWRGERDLFLELNQSREPSAIQARAARMPIRRWLARLSLGHDLIVGDLVEVRSWSEICNTLDSKGCLDGLPFMPEMLQMCGKSARVFRSAHRIFDYRKTRRMRHLHGAVLLAGTVCDGSSHGGCEAACHTIWKAAWLRRIDNAPGLKTDAATEAARDDHAVLQSGCIAPRYTCQLTQLNAATEAVGNRNFVNFIRPLVSGNVTVRAFAVGWLTHLFNVLQDLRGGVSFPAFEQGEEGGRKPDDLHLHLQSGDTVLVRSSAAIRSTLNDRFRHRGLWFETDMLKYCGRPSEVQAEVKKLIDIVTGEMRTMKTPAYILRDVHFSGERQLFNAQYEPLFWRGVWLLIDETSRLKRDEVASSREGVHE